MKVGAVAIRATCANSEILPECTDEVFYGLPRPVLLSPSVSRNVLINPLAFEQSNKLWGMAC